MKRISILFLLSIGLMSLSGCNHRDTDKSKVSEEPQTAESTEKSKEKPEQKSTPSEQNKSSESSEEVEKPKSENTIRDEKGSTSDLGKARIALYEAGIDSHTLTDDEVLTVWKKSKTNEEFIKNIRQLLEK